jgi:hypothetical protein
MYVAQVRSGRFEIVENLEALDPQEHLVDTPTRPRDRRIPHNPVDGRLKVRSSDRLRPSSRDEFQSR